MIDLVNSSMTWIFDLLQAPFRDMDPIWSLVLFSVLSGIVLLLIYGKVSNQNAIRDTKRKIHAALLESILFRHDLRLSLGAQWRMLIYGAKYFLLAVPPIVILAVPCLLILAQLNLRYNAEPLQPGERALVKVTVANPSDLFHVTASAPGAELTPPVRIASKNEVVWELKASDSSASTLSIRNQDKGTELESPLFVGAQDVLRVASVHSQNWLMKVLYPDGEGLLEKAPWIQELQITYPERRYPLFGVHMHWLVVFLLISILAGIFASKIFRVEI